MRRKRPEVTPQQRTAKARKTFQASFEHAADPFGLLTPDERASRVKELRSAYFARLGRAGGHARARYAAEDRAALLSQGGVDDVS
jgi:hypothetical protein